MGVVANVQPQFVHSDAPIALQRVGQERLASSYAWKTLWQAGAVVCGGSDAPVEEPRPLHGMYYAITRKGSDGRSLNDFGLNVCTLYSSCGSVMTPSEQLSFDEALEMYTTNAGDM